MLFCHWSFYLHLEVGFWRLGVMWVTIERRSWTWPTPQLALPPSALRRAWKMRICILLCLNPVSERLSPELGVQNPESSSCSEWQTVSELVCSIETESSTCSDWETVSELDITIPEDTSMQAISMPVMPWKLVSLDMPPRKPLDGTRISPLDPRRQHYAAFFERL